jgi:predicted dinucleotide-binding enzyme
VVWNPVVDVLAEAGDLGVLVVIIWKRPMSDDDSALVVGHTSSGAEALARKVRGAHVVSAFGTVPSEVLFAVYETRRRKRRPSLVYCGDDARAKTTAATLIRDVGFDPLDLGPLEMARHTEPFTMLVAKLAYEGDTGPAIAYRFDEYEERE